MPPMPPNAPALNPGQCPICLKQLKANRYIRPHITNVHPNHVEITKGTYVDRGTLPPNDARKNGPQFLINHKSFLTSTSHPTTATGLPVPSSDPYFDEDRLSNYNLMNQLLAKQTTTKVTFHYNKKNPANKPSVPQTQAASSTSQATSASSSGTAIGGSQGSSHHLVHQLQPTSATSTAPTYYTLPNAGNFPTHHLVQQLQPTSATSTAPTYYTLPNTGNFPTSVASQPQHGHVTRQRAAPYTVLQRGHAPAGTTAKTFWCYNCCLDVTPPHICQGIGSSGRPLRITPGTYWGRDFPEVRVPRGHLAPGPAPVAVRTPAPQSNKFWCYGCNDDVTDPHECPYGQVMRTLPESYGPTTPPEGRS